MQDLIKQIKRVRVVLGTLEMLEVVDSQGNKVEMDETPFIWEIDNRDAFKMVGNSFYQTCQDEASTCAAHDYCQHRGA